jgi:hypothetical protein
MDRIWHCPNGETVEMSPEEVKTMDFLNLVLEYDWEDDVECDEDLDDLP